MNQIVVVLGSNIEKEKMIPAAIMQLAQACRLSAVSPVYETQPVHELEQPTYFNAAVLLTTAVSPSQLKETVLRPIEAALGRVRSANKNASRTIDLDIVLVQTADGRLQLLDEELNRFAHIIVPVAAIVPDWEHPVSGERMQQLAARSSRETERAR